MITAAEVTAKTLKVVFAKNRSKRPIHFFTTAYRYLMDNKNRIRGGSEIAQSLISKHDSLSLVPKIHVKKLGMVVCSYNPSIRGMRVSGSLGFAV